MKNRLVFLLGLSGVFFFSLLFGRSEEKKTAALQPPSFFPTVFTIAPLEQKKESDKKWFFRIGALAANKAGNTNTFSANGETALTYDDGRTEFFVGYETFYGHADGQRNENNGKGTLQLDHYIFASLELFLLSQNDYDEMTRLVFRNNSGAGAKWVFFRNVFWTTDISFAPMYQYEQFKHTDATHQFRGSFRGRIKITPFDFLTVSFVYFHIPKLTEPAVFRSVIDSAAELRLIQFGRIEKSGMHFKAGYQQCRRLGHIADGRNHLRSANI